MIDDRLDLYIFHFKFGRDLSGFNGGVTPFSKLASGRVNHMFIDSDLFVLL